jgi:hypothetical protein
MTSPSNKRHKIEYLKNPILFSTIILIKFFVPPVGRFGSQPSGIYLSPYTETSLSGKKVVKSYENCIFLSSPASVFLHRAIVYPFRQVVSYFGDAPTGRFGQFFAKFLNNIRRFFD